MPFGGPYRRFIAQHLPGLVRLKNAISQSQPAVSEDEAAALVREVARALRKGRSLPFAQMSVAQHLALLRGLIETEGLGLSKAYAASPGLPLGRFAAYDALVLLVRAAPGSKAGDAGDLPSRTAQDGFIALTAQRRQKLLLVFTGMARQFGCPLPLIHQWFRGLDCSLVYLFDVQATYYLGGVPGLAETLQGTAERLRGLADEIGAESTFCIGNSGGGFGALLYGPLVGARRSLSLSPPTVIRESLAPLCARLPQLQSLVSADGTISLAAFHRQSSVRPQARVYFPAENPHDSEEAKGLAGLAGLEVRPVAGVKDHNLVPVLVSRGSFDRELQWLTAS